MLADPDEADASVQAAFVTAWSAAARFDPHKLSAKTWLVTLTHRLIMRRVRGRASGSPLPEGKGVSPQPIRHTGGVDANPPMSLLTAEARDLLERAFFQGRTHQDLANLTGRTLEDIKQELRTALERLSSDLGEHQP